jgi:alpha-1,2-mannosyltransferase
MAWVFVLALAPRLWLIFRAVQQGALGGYDAAVYYSAADALLHGRMPYHGDFVMLHPPLVILVGVPFALIGSLADAQTGLVLGSVAFAVMSAATASLITSIARRWGAPWWGALVAGIFYATWSVTVTAGSEMRLEPLGDLLLASAVWLLSRQGETSLRELALAGVALGALANVKLWWFVPIVLLLLLIGLNARRWVVVAVPLVVAAVTACLIDLPFLAVAGSRMFSSIVTTQLGRPDLQGSPSGAFARRSVLTRLKELTGVSDVFGRFVPPADLATSVTAGAVTVVVCLAFALTALVALRNPMGRVFVPIVAAQVLVLLTSPVYFAFYGDYVVVAASLVIAAAARARGVPLPGAVWAAWPAIALITLVAVVTAPTPPQLSRPPDSEALAAATRGVRCLVADSPGVLIRIDALDRSFENGCRNWVDIQGIGHGGGPDPDAHVLARTSTPAWRRIMTRYFRSGDAVILSDPNIRLFLGPSRVRLLTSGPVIAQSHGLVVYRVVRPVR